MPRKAAKRLRHGDCKGQRSVLPAHLSCVGTAASAAGARLAPLLKIAAISLVGLILLGWFLLWFFFARGLPSEQMLLHYRAAAADQCPRHRRHAGRRPSPASGASQLPIDEFPPLLVHAFISAEDKTFFSHQRHRLSRPRSARCSIMSRKRGTGERAAGGSTITQQVAKNLLLGNEYSVSRKIREAILAYRIEDTLTKQQILELYLNQIFLGRNAYGVQAAARAYFDKDVDRARPRRRCAFLAILPKAPANYDPDPPSRARARAAQLCARARCCRTAIITPAQHDAARRRRRSARSTRRAARSSSRNVGGYFMEEVRRELIEHFGENADRRPEQRLCRRPVGAHLARSRDAGRGRAGAARRPDALRERPRLARTRRQDRPRPATGAASSPSRQFGTGYPDWRAAVVLDKQGGSATLGFADGSDRQLPAWGAAMPQARHRRRAPSTSLRPGDVIAVKQQGGALGAALDPARSRAAWSSRRSAYRPGAGDAGRLRRARLGVQPRHPGAAPAGLDASSRSSIRPRSTTA